MPIFTSKYKCSTDGKLNNVHLELWHYVGKKVHDRVSKHK